MESGFCVLRMSGMGLECRPALIRRLGYGRQRLDASAHTRISFGAAVIWFEVGVSIERIGISPPGGHQLAARKARFSRAEV